MASQSATVTAAAASEADACSGSSSFTIEPSPNSTWKPGQTMQAASMSAAPFHIIDTSPGGTAIDPKMLYKVMNGGIAPRPIALVGTYSDDGTANLAPMSWYNMVSHDPPLVMISFGGARERVKDGEHNILTRKVFTISSTSEAYAEAANFAAVNAPTGTSEFALCGLTPAAGVKVRAPRVKEAPFSMELELDFFRQWSNAAGEQTTTLVVGRVRCLHVRADVVAADGSIDPGKTHPVARHSGTLYARSTHGYELPVPRWEQSKDAPEVQAALASQPLDTPPAVDDAIPTILDVFPSRTSS